MDAGDQEREARARSLRVAEGAPDPGRRLVRSVVRRPAAAGEPSGPGDAEAAIARAALDLPDGPLGLAAAEPVGPTGRARRPRRRG